jgi:hypothetical protein
MTMRPAAAERRSGNSGRPLLPTQRYAEERGAQHGRRQSDKPRARTKSEQPPMSTDRRPETL